MLTVNSSLVENLCCDELLCVSLEQGFKTFYPHILLELSFVIEKKNYMFHRLSIKMLLLIYAQDGFVYFDRVGHMIMPIINQIKTLINTNKKVPPALDTKLTNSMVNICLCLYTSLCLCVPSRFPYLWNPRCNFCLYVTFGQIVHLLWPTLDSVQMEKMIHWASNLYFLPSMF